MASLPSSSAGAHYRARCESLLPSHRYHDLDMVKRFIDLAEADMYQYAGVLQALRENLVEHASALDQGIRYLDKTTHSELSPEANVAAHRISELEATVARLKWDTAAAKAAWHEAETVSRIGLQRVDELERENDELKARLKQARELEEQNADMQARLQLALEEAGIDRRGEALDTVRDRVRGKLVAVETRERAEVCEAPRRGRFRIHDVEAVKAFIDDVKRVIGLIPDSPGYPVSTGMLHALRSNLVERAVLLDEGIRYLDGTLRSDPSAGPPPPPKDKGKAAAHHIHNLTRQVTQLDVLVAQLMGVANASRAALRESESGFHALRARVLQLEGQGEDAALRARVEELEVENAEMKARLRLASGETGVSGESEEALDAALDRARAKSAGVKTEERAAETEDSDEEIDDLAEETRPRADEPETTKKHMFRIHDAEHVREFIKLVLSAGSNARTGTLDAGAERVLHTLRADLVDHLAGIVSGLQYLDERVGASTPGEPAPPAYSRTPALEAAIPPETTPEPATMRIAELEVRLLQLSRDVTSANNAAAVAAGRAASLRATVRRLEAAAAKVVETCREEDNRGRDREPVGQKRQYSPIIYPSTLLVPDPEAFRWAFQVRNALRRKPQPSHNEIVAILLAYLAMKDTGFRESKRTDITRDVYLQRKLTRIERSYLNWYPLFGAVRKVYGLAQRPVVKCNLEMGVVLESPPAYKKCTCASAADKGSGGSD
ncbi:hypothetical protein Q8F55_008243 [Vanrija albida]|uniref:Uncharacterized protein n=1 Tax=Vanrija albida TaxID=181172 RepID=A0ABR3PWM7_9TREE